MADGRVVPRVLGAENWRRNTSVSENRGVAKGISGDRAVPHQDNHILSREQ